MRLRNKLLSAAFGFALGLGGFALAQVVSSLQLSQDSRGYFGVDTTKTHLISTSAPPVLSTCGTSPTIVGSDAAGLITTGSAATTCTATFATAYLVAPACAVSPQGTATYPTFTVSTTAITFSIDIASTKYMYVCVSTG